MMFKAYHETAQPKSFQTISEAVEYAMDELNAFPDGNAKIVSVDDGEEHEIFSSSLEHGYQLTLDRLFSDALKMFAEAYIPAGEYMAAYRHGEEMVDMYENIAGGLVTRHGDGLDSSEEIAAFGKAIDDFRQKIIDIATTADETANVSLKTDEIADERKDKIIKDLIRNNLETDMDPSQLLNALRRCMTDEEIEAYGYGYLLSLEEGGK